MAELKTKQTDANVKTYLNAIEDEQRRADCLELVEIMRKATKLEPQMWGSAIVGFGSYHYKYESGHEGDACRVGFSPRKGDISIYIVPGFEGKEELLNQLGKHKIGKVCLYVKRLPDIKIPILEKLIKDSVAEMRRRYP